MGLAIDGLVSGLDTAALIDSLMQLEAVPQTLLKRKSSATETMVAALQALNSRVANIAELADKTSKAGALDLFTATSSAESATVTTGTGASQGSIDIVVDHLAQRQVSVSDAMTAWPETSFTLTAADGTATTIAADSNSLADVAQAINESTAGVTAITVAAGTDPVTGETLHRLQLTATEHGSAGAFTLSGTTAQTTQVSAGQDAQVTLWAGTAASQTVTSPSNTFTDLLPGVSVTVSEAGTTPITIDVARDDEKIGAQADELVTALNGLFGFIAANSSVTAANNSDGTAGTQAGVFTGNSLVRDVNRRIMDAATAPVDGRSPSEIGLSITRDGTIEFDDEKFQAALASDPALVESTLQTIAGRVAGVAEEASDKYDGTITSKITGQESLVESLGSQILQWDNRLATRRSTLERTYASLEVQLSRLNSQSSWLTSQLASLSTGSSDK